MRTLIIVIVKVLISKMEHISYNYYFNVDC